MRLPQPLLDSPFFQFEHLEEFERALAPATSVADLQEIRRLAELGLPPVASASALATLLGINQGIIWSFVNRPHKHYRTFSIPKGASRRQIDAPRVALKVAQKWLATQLALNYQAPPHVFGFVKGRSHLRAAQVHAPASWVLSLDIQDFFPSTPTELVERALKGLGFNDAGAALIASLSCFKGNLAQGAPTSPILSNICFAQWDDSLSQLATSSGSRLTRYADDIVFSGAGTYPEGLKEHVVQLLAGSPWKVADHKSNLALAPSRRKVHGLLVHDGDIRLTKGYRNKLRAYRHLLASGKDLDTKFKRKAIGHLSYEKSLALLSGPRTT